MCVKHAADAGDVDEVDADGREVLNVLLRVVTDENDVAIGFDEGVEDGEGSFGELFLGRESTFSGEGQSDLRREEIKNHTRS